MIQGIRPGLLTATLVQLSLALPALLLPAAAAAQVMAGRVVDAITGAPVPAATVRALEADTPERLAVVTDSAGTFALSMPAGSYALRIEHFGYETLETEPLTVARDERVQLEIRLGPLPFEVEPVVVQARQVARSSQFRRRMEQRRATGMGRFITREEIEGTVALGINELLAREIGLEIASVQGTEVIVIRARGRTCLPALYVDGVRVVHDRRIPLDLSHLFRPDMIEGIEIYRSPLSAPADLRTGGCGAIVVWTRSDREGTPFTLRRLITAAGFVALFVLLRAL